MNSKTAIRKLTLGSLALAAFAGAGLAFTPNVAQADTGSRQGVGVLKSMDGGQTWADGGTPAGTFTLTFQGQTTGSVFSEPVTFTATVQPTSPAGDGTNIGVGELQECTISKSMDMASTKLTQFAINGNAPAADDRLGNFEIQHLMSDLNNSDGAKGGNVEYEWKVEEGES